MENIIELIKILLPAAIVLYGMYLVVRLFVNREISKISLEKSTIGRETILNTRLQAYERVILFLERIHPYNMVIRLQSPNLNCRAFHEILLSNVREEFNHNISQQLYTSQKAWDLVVKTKEEVVGIINVAADSVDSDASSVELSKVIIGYLASLEKQPNDQALKVLKQEISAIF